MSHDEKPEELASVLSLACARVRDAIAEGELDESLNPHLDQCDACAALAAETQGVTALIAEATAPLSPPGDLASRVLDRANTLTLDLEPELDEQARSETAGSTLYRWPLVAALASAAAVALAFWAGGMSAQLSPPEVSAPGVAVAPAVAPAETVTQNREGPSEVTLRPAGGAIESPSTQAPVHTPEPLAVPEPTMDIPAEIQAALLQVIEDKEGCPKSSGGSVRITATIEPSGAIVDRQIFSSGEVTRAHRCVTEALDGLRLPPLAQRARVTLDLRW
jgi:hypothetical protein